MNESQLKKKVNDEFKKRTGGLVFNISERYSSGIPDSYWAWRGYSCWVEYKVDSNNPTKIQTKRINDLDTQKIPSLVVKYKNNKDSYYIILPGEHYCMIETGGIENLIDEIKSYAEGTC